MGQLVSRKANRNLLVAALFFLFIAADAATLIVVDKNPLTRWDVFFGALAVVMLAVGAFVLIVAFIAYSRERKLRALEASAGGSTDKD